VQRFILTAFMVAVAGTTIAAPVPPRNDKPPTGPTPQVLTVTEVDASAGTIILQHTEQVAVPVAVLKEVENAGVKKVVPVTEYRTEMRTFMTKSELSGFKCYTADGKELTAKELLGKLKPGSIIIFSSSSDKVDPAYLRLFKPDTLVLASTAPAVPRGNVAPVPVLPPAQLPRR
jgi:hypothetical protein